MKILLVAATYGEIASLLQYLGLVEELTQDHSQFQYRHFDIEVLITGAGMVHTTFHLSRLLFQKTYDLAINVGIAGSFDKKLDIGEIVRVQSQVFGDLGAEDKDSFIPIAEMVFFDENQFPYQGGKLLSGEEKAMGKSIVLFPILKKKAVVSSITVNRVLGKKSSIDEAKKIFNPDIESMEGGAFFYACLMSKQDFVELRAISNYVEVRNKANWNIPLAVKNLNQLLIEMFES